MNERHIEQVMQIEKEAQQLLDAARQEAARLPVEAEREAQQLIEKTRSEAQAQAKQMIADAGAQDEAGRVLSAVDQKIRQTEQTAEKNLDRAVEYVLERLLGKA